MPAPRVFVDTNVLVYVRDAADANKQRAAAEWMAALWGSRTGRISLQVLQEYYVTVTAKLKPGLPEEDAREDVLALALWRPVESSLALLEDAWAVKDCWGFGFWDALIVAAARSAGCELLLTEDLAHDQDLGGLRVVSPFRVSPEGF